MLKVRKHLCLGCGLCAENCPRWAISLLWGHAEIDHDRCDSCRLCLEICPEGAIVEAVVVSEGELKVTVASLNQKANALLARIERLRR